MNDKKLTALVAVLGIGLILEQAFPSIVYAQWQSVESIRTTALSFAKKNIRFPDARTDFHVGVLDPNHRLPSCGAALQGFLLPQTRLSHDSIVGVRCPGTKPWKVYVPVQIATFRPVFVTQRPIARGTQLTRDDLKQETRNVRGRDYVVDERQFDNKHVKRDLPSGTILTQKMLHASVLIKRGQTVTLVSKNSGLNVRMNGKALESGILNQRIRVRNSGSKREVEGIVRSNQIIEIML